MLFEVLFYLCGRFGAPSINLCLGIHPESRHNFDVINFSETSANSVNRSPIEAENNQMLCLSFGVRNRNRFCDSLARSFDGPKARRATETA
jgi:hypothetical protein